MRETKSPVSFLASIPSDSFHHCRFRDHTRTDAAAREGSAVPLHWKKSGRFLWPGRQRARLRLRLRRVAIDSRFQTARPGSETKARRLPDLYHEIAD